MQRLAVTLSISVFGAFCFFALNLPLPMLLGPLFGCLLAALMGVRLQSMPRVAPVMRTILGLAIGTSITPALFLNITDILPTLLLMPVLVIAVGLGGYVLFRKVFGFDHATAFYGVMPGGLQDMLLFGEEAGGNPRALGLMHATRVLVLVTVLPFVISYALEIDLSQAPGEAVSDLPIPELILMAISAIAGWKIAARLGLWGASLLGPLILGAVLSITGILTHRPPAEAIFIAQFFIGFIIGVKYNGITVDELVNIVLASLIYTVLILGISAVFVVGATALEVFSTLEAILVFSPGGQGEMAVVAIMAGADVAVVVAHHLVRLIFVILCAPIFAKLAQRYL